MKVKDLCRNGMTMSEEERLKLIVCLKVPLVNGPLRKISHMYGHTMGGETKEKEK